jgi:hypothetical protein
MKFFDSLSGKRPATATAGPSASKRNAETVSAELDANKETADALATKIATAQADVESASRAYDADIKSYALDSGKQPDRKALDNAIATLDGLRRVAADNARAVASLESELRTVQLADAVTNEGEALDALIDQSEASLVAFMRAAAEAKQCEKQLFAVLFDERTGLKRSFATPELLARAKQARREIRTEAIETANHLGFKINPDFSTDGNANLGDPGRVREYQTLDFKRDAERSRAYFARESQLRDLVAARTAANEDYQHPLYEVGQIVPEVPVDR